MKRKRSHVHYVMSLCCLHCNELLPFASNRELRTFYHVCLRFKRGRLPFKTESGFLWSVEGQVSRVKCRGSRVTCRGWRVKSRGSKEKVEGRKYFKDSGFYSNFYFYYWQRLKMYFNFFIF